MVRSLSISGLWCRIFCTLFNLGLKLPLASTYHSERLLGCQGEQSSPSPWSSPVPSPPTRLPPRSLLPEPAICQTRPLSSPCLSPQLPFPSPRCSASTGSVLAFNGVKSCYVPNARGCEVSTRSSFTLTTILGTSWVRLLAQSTGLARRPFASPCSLLLSVELGYELMSISFQPRFLKGQVVPFVITGPRRKVCFWPAT